MKISSLLEDNNPSQRNAAKATVNKWERTGLLEGLKGEESISEICGKEGIAPALYYPLEQGLY